MTTVSSTLTPLTSATVAWHTEHMHRPLGTVEKLGKEPASREYLRSIAPASLQGINLRGGFDFPNADYVDRFIPSFMVARRHRRTTHVEISLTARWSKL
ncbi:MULTISPECIES: hypothetical protein [Burkholderia]|uniref:hypothetical protein n=1 Tax=Burkholderia TaxID=32008 RepID=UPI001589C56D|nr:hypothetical protein [Burkholderia ambifaria]